MKRVFAATGMVVALAAAHPAHAKPRCVLGAVLDGEAALVAPIARALADLDITTPAPDCPAIRATVARANAGLTVTIQDPSGRSSRRQVTDAKVAATFIESWVRTDIEAPLIAPRRPMSRAPAATIAVATHTAAPEPPARLSLSAGAATGNGDDHSGWSAITVGACWKLGPLCLGAIGRFADNPDFSNELAATPAQRHTADALLEARLSIPFGQATVAPRVAAGVGWLRSSRNTLNCIPNLEDPGDPECLPDPANFTVTTRGLQVDLGVTLTIPVTRGLAIDLGVGYQLAPGAHRDSFAPEGYLPLTDPADEPPLPDPVLLPGEPQSWLWWGLGLRLGAM